MVKGKLIDEATLKKLDDGFRVNVVNLVCLIPHCGVVIVVIIDSSGDVVEGNLAFMNSKRWERLVIANFAILGKLRNNSTELKLLVQLDDEVPIKSKTNTELNDDSGKTNGRKDRESREKDENYN